MSDPINFIHELMILNNCDSTLDQDIFTDSRLQERFLRYYRDVDSFLLPQCNTRTKHHTNRLSHCYSLSEDMETQTVKIGVILILWLVLMSRLLICFISTFEQRLCDLGLLSSSSDNDVKISLYNRCYKQQCLIKPHPKLTALWLP